MSSNLQGLPKRKVHDESRAAALLNLHALSLQSLSSPFIYYVHICETLDTVAMRLLLTIQRHGLPPARVLWTLASAVRPPLVAASNSITVSQFLEQVNEVIPIESEDWGLEDYSVEVRGFECLHFQELNQVLREDDEVWWVIFACASGSGFEFF